MSALALEQIGRRWGWKLEWEQNLDRVRGVLESGGRIAVYQDAGRDAWWQPWGEWPNTLERLSGLPAEGPFQALLLISDRLHTAVAGELGRHTLVFRPPSLTVGVDCSPTATLEEIEAAFHTVFRQHRLSPASLGVIAGVRASAEHPDLADFAETMGVPLLPYMNDRVGVFRRLTSSAGRETNVCEAAALLAAGGMELVVPCTQSGEVALAVGRRAGA